MVAAGAGGVVVEEIVHTPVWAAAPDVDDEVLEYGDDDELDIDGNPIDSGAVDGDADADVTVEPEPENELLRSWVGSTADIHELLVGYGQHGSMVMIGSWIRGGATGELTPHEHADLGRAQRVTGVWRSSYDLGDGAGSFSVGRPSNWTFADGIGTFQGGTVATAWRFSGQTKPAKVLEVDPELTRRQVADAVAVVEDAMRSVLVRLRGQNPGEALGLWAEASTLVMERSRILDAGVMVARQLPAEEWLVAKDVEFPELIQNEIQINEAFSSKFSEGLAFAERRRAEYVATRRNIAGIPEHIEDLRAALRGLAANGRILRERQGRAGGAGE